MKNKILISTSLLATLLFTGCGMYIKTNEYNVSADNVQTQRNYQDLKLDVSNFTASNKDESSVMCRLGRNCIYSKR